MNFNLKLIFDQTFRLFQISSFYVVLSSFITADDDFIVKMFIVVIIHFERSRTEFAERTFFFFLFKKIREN